MPVLFVRRFSADRHREGEAVKTTRIVRPVTLAADVAAASAAVLCQTIPAILANDAADIHRELASHIEAAIHAYEEAKVGWGSDGETGESAVGA